MSQLALDGVDVFGVGDELGRVYTPLALSRAIVAAIRIDGLVETVVEPSVGGGSLVLAARERWPEAQYIGVDKDRGAKGFEDCDEVFLADWLEFAPEWAKLIGRDVHSTLIVRPDLVIGNPDFGRKDCKIPLAHTEAALSLRPRVCAFILPFSYLCNKTWAPLLEKHPPFRVHRIIGRVWRVVREVAVYEFHDGFTGETRTSVLPGFVGSTR